MGWFSFLDPVLNSIFSPLLNLKPIFAIMILSFIVTLIITLIYKYTTDQNLMKQLKGELKELQKQMKELKNEPKKAMEVQKRAMQTNMKYMMQSMKATLFTFIPIILIFGWVQAHYAFEPINPYEEFLVEAQFTQDGDNITLTVPEPIELLSSSTPEVKTNKASWAVKGPPGDYVFQFDYKDKVFTKKVKINYMLYEQPTTLVNYENLKLIKTDQAKRIVLNLFGWELGWLGAYIIFSIIFSIILRKFLKVY